MVGTDYPPHSGQCGRSYIHSCLQCRLDGRRLLPGPVRGIHWNRYGGDAAEGEAQELHRKLQSLQELFARQQAELNELRNFCAELKLEFSSLRRLLPSRDRPAAAEIDVETLARLILDNKDLFGPIIQHMAKRRQPRSE